MSDDTNWAEAGRALIRRRVDLDRAYRNRRTFATKRGIDYAIAYRLEKGLGRRYEEATKAVIEAAYALVPGSFDRMAATGIPEPLPTGASDRAAGSRVPSALGRVLVQRRISRGLARQDEFAAAAGLAISVVDDLETGQHRSFSPAEVAALASGYGLDVPTLELAITSGELPPATPAPEPSPSDHRAWLHWFADNAEPWQLAGAVNVAHLMRHPPAAPPTQDERRTA